MTKIRVLINMTFYESDSAARKLTSSEANPLHFDLAPEIVRDTSGNSSLFNSILPPTNFIGSEHYFKLFATVRIFFTAIGGGLMPLTAPKWLYYALEFYRRDDPDHLDEALNYVKKGPIPEWGTPEWSIYTLLVFCNNLNDSWGDRSFKWLFNKKKDISTQIKERISGIIWNLRTQPKELISERRAELKMWVLEAVKRFEASKTEQRRSLQDKTPGMYLRDGCLLHVAETGSITTPLRVTFGVQPYFDNGVIIAKKEKYGDCLAYEFLDLVSGETFPIEDR